MNFLRVPPAKVKFLISDEGLSRRVSRPKTRLYTLETESLKNLETRLEGLETRLQSLEMRLESLETRLETRLESLETRLEILEKRLPESRVRFLNPQDVNLGAKFSYTVISYPVSGVYRDHRICGRNSVGSLLRCSPQSYVALRSSSSFPQDGP